jgi:hypothetical protein
MIKEIIPTKMEANPMTFANISPITILFDWVEK